MKDYLLKKDTAEFKLTERLGYAWRTIGETLGVDAGDLEVLQGNCEVNEARLKMVWNRWFNRTEELSHGREYPNSWGAGGLFKLLHSDRKTQSVSNDFREHFM